MTNEIAQLIQQPYFECKTKKHTMAWGAAEFCFFGRSGSLANPVFLQAVFFSGYLVDAYSVVYFAGEERKKVGKSWSYFFRLVCFSSIFSNEYVYVLPAGSLKFWMF